MHSSHFPEAVPERSRTQLVVRLPDFSIVDLRSTGDRTGAHDPIIHVAEMFDADTGGLIDQAVLPALLANEVWSGDLPLVLNDQTEFVPTTWVPHTQPHPPTSGAAPALATIIIGDARDATTAAIDPLTGLPTRVLLLDRLDQALRRGRRSGELIAVLFIDLDGLKSINDRHGHELGDSALVHTAVGIRSCLREGDTVARLGGDEFVVVCEDLGTELQAEVVGDRIIEALARIPIQPVSASIGIAFDRGGSLDALELVSRSDAAMYQAKASGGARVEVFDKEMQGRLAADRTRRAVLSEALQRDAIDFVTQPIFRLSTGQIIGVEMFIRMRDRPDAPAIEAGEVLRLIREQTQVIDAAMLSRAVETAWAWRQEFGMAAPRVHLNVSALSLASDSYVGLVQRLLTERRLSPTALAFEVSSAEISPGDSREIAAMLALGSMGAGIVVDGYGVGSTSLPLIARIRPSMVKITPFDAGRSESFDPAVVVGLTRAAASLGLTTCVKGIESQEMLERVVRAGTFAGQGHALAPVTALEETRQRFRSNLGLGY